jgi:SAM-dependent methyltransferase/putative flippase GtrA
MKSGSPVNNSEKIANELELAKYSFKSVTSSIEQILGRYAWIKFAIVGGLGSLIHMVILFSLTEFISMWYMFSAGIAVLVSATYNYVLNHVWTFKGKKIKNHTIGWIKYIILALVFDGAYLLLLSFFTESIGLWYVISAFMALLIIFPFRYNISRLWIWGDFKFCNLISTKHPNDADYDWYACANGSFVQKWWKTSIAKATWDFIPGGSNVLDIGCGSSPIFTRYGGVGIDINNDKVEFMKGNKNSGDKRRYMVGDARRLPFEDNTFDSVLCIEVIEHIDNPEKVITEISRVAKPNAKIVMATPDYSRPLAHLLDIMTPYGDDHTSRFTKNSLSKLCLDHGLEPLNHKYIGGCDMVALFKKTDAGLKVVNSTSTKWNG